MVRALYIYYLCRYHYYKHLSGGRGGARARPPARESPCKYYNGARERYRVTIIIMGTTPVGGRAGDAEVCPPEQSSPRAQPVTPYNPRTGFGPADLNNRRRTGMTATTTMMMRAVGCTPDGVTRTRAVGKQNVGGGREARPFRITIYLCTYTSFFPFTVRGITLYIGIVPKRGMCLHGKDDACDGSSIRARGQRRIYSKINTVGT